MSSEFQIQRRVEFCETDAAGIAHFSAFFLYMEQAEHALLRHLGLSVVMRDEAGVITWPRVSAHCDYTSAVKFEDVLDLALTIKRLGDKSVTYSCRFSLNGVLAASGTLTSVCCRLLPDQPPKSIPIPPWIAERLKAYAPAAAS